MASVLLRNGILVAGRECGRDGSAGAGKLGTDMAVEAGPEAVYSGQFGWTANDDRLITRPVAPMPLNQKSRAKS